jgi:hypothetical protein
MGHITLYAHARMCAGTRRLRVRVRDTVFSGLMRRS